MKKTPFIWKNGEFLDWDDAKTHVLTHGLHYGMSVFEGIRAYKTETGTKIFKGIEHFDRFHRSADIYGLDIPYSSQALLDASNTLLEKNQLDAAYIRPLAYYGYGKMGLNPEGCPTDIIIAAWEWGAYLGEENLVKGIRCKISSWARIDSRILPPQAKSSANYANSFLAKKEAVTCGYDEAILLNLNGHVAEGSVENLFMVKAGQIVTPPTSDNALSGITRNTAIDLAKSLGYTIIERSISRDELYGADELFMTGTAIEVVPVRVVDTYTIGSGSRGPITEQIQAEYATLVRKP